MHIWLNSLDGQTTPAGWPYHSREGSRAVASRMGSILVFELI